MDQSDEQLMLRVARNGDEQAFGELLQRYRGLLVNHFRRIGVYEGSEDLAQTTFTRLYLARKRYQPRARFKTYLFVVARNCWKDEIRSRSRHQRKLLALFEAPRPALHTPRCDRSDIAAALDTLSPEHREVVALRIWQGFSLAEIAETTGIPLGTVKSRLHHAYQQLKDRLDDPSH